MIITKEGLISARESVNEAILKIKQQYSASKERKKILIIVEGKDDITYYGVKAVQHLTDRCKFFIIPAGNRKKVIDAYDQMDWTQYSKEKILFIIDRDLSDYTKERTPNDDNIYVTNKYSIENELCSFSTFLNTLKYYGDLSDIDDKDEMELEQFYLKQEQEFFKLMDPIMGLILYCKNNKISANYANLNCNHLFSIDESGLKVKEEFKSKDSLIGYVCGQSGISYDASVDISAYIIQLKSLHSQSEYIRGKYLLYFFVAAINFVITNSDKILSSGKKGRLSLSIGHNNAISQLCALMPIPPSLNSFLVERVDALHSIA